jgi:hypothetical protein
MAAWGVLLLMTALCIWAVRSQVTGDWRTTMGLPPKKAPAPQARAKSKREIDAEVDKFAAWLRGVRASDFDFPERLSSR